MDGDGVDEPQAVADDGSDLDDRLLGLEEREHADEGGDDRQQR